MFLKRRGSGGGGWRKKTFVERTSPEVTERRKKKKKNSKKLCHGSKQKKVKEKERKNDKPNLVEWYFAVFFFSELFLVFSLLFSFGKKKSVCASLCGGLLVLEKTENLKEIKTVFLPFCTPVPPVLSPRPAFSSIFLSFFEGIFLSLFLFCVVKRRFSFFCSLWKMMMIMIHEPLSKLDT